MKVSNQSN